MSEPIYRDGSYSVQVRAMDDGWVRASVYHHGESWGRAGRAFYATPGGARLHPRTWSRTGEDAFIGVMMSVPFAAALVVPAAVELSMWLLLLCPLVPCAAYLAAAHLGPGLNRGVPKAIERAVRHAQKHARRERACLAAVDEAERSVESYQAMAEAQETVERMLAR